GRASDTGNPRQHARAVRRTRRLTQRVRRARAFMPPTIRGWGLAVRAAPVTGALILVLVVADHIHGGKFQRIDGDYFQVEPALAALYGFALLHFVVDGDGVIAFGTNNSHGK